MMIRRIDIFIMRKYASYCREISYDNYYGNKQQLLSYEDYKENNKCFLIEMYKQYRRNQKVNG